MKKIGIITIHKIYNYGSVLQAYALQKKCEDLGFGVEIIDYEFPNQFHQHNQYNDGFDSQPNEPQWIKLLFSRALMRQHKGISSFVKNYQHLSRQKYNTPESLKSDIPVYDVYISGSDQIWSPRHCKGDPAFMLHFAPNNSTKISYASSIGSDIIPSDLQSLYKELLSRYDCISVRENSGVDIIHSLTGKDVEVVLDPTLLLDKNEWNQIAISKRLVKKKYILCYFLNYTFNAFPYVDKLARHIQRITGYKIVQVARPSHSLFSSKTIYQIGASPEEFISLIRDAEMILTTSFHGTAFAVNYGKPVFTIVKDKKNGDSRQVSLMQNLGLEDKVLSMYDAFPKKAQFFYDLVDEQRRLNNLRCKSMDYIKKAINNE